MTIWRVAKASHGRAANDGEGARLNGGRWNSPGLPAVYLSATKSLALLEILVHLDPNDAPKRWNAFRVVMEPGQIETRRVSTQVLRQETRTRRIGDAWLTSRRTLALAVPSVIVPEELNYILNPAHPSFAAFDFGRPLPFSLDLRLLS